MHLVTILVTHALHVEPCTRDVEPRCRSDSKLEFGVQNHVCWKTQNRRPVYGVWGSILVAFGRLLVLEKSGPDLVKSGPDFACSIFQKRIFMGQICSNFMGVTFTINIGIVSV
jgi:hypothetical protein